MTMPDPLDGTSTPCKGCTATAYYRYSANTFAQFYCPTCRTYTTLNQKETTDAQLTQTRRPVHPSETKTS